MHLLHARFSDLQIALRVSELQSFSKVATELNKDYVSFVQVAVDRLEKHLAFRLFTRSRRGKSSIILTDQGREFFTKNGDLIRNISQNL